MHPPNGPEPIRRPPPAPRRPPGGRTTARHRFTTRFLPLLIATLVLVTLVAWTATGGSGRGSTGPPRPGPAGATAGAATTRRGPGPTTTAPAPTTTAPPAPTTTTNPAGTLPQTTAYPTSDTAQFHSEMAQLWQGIVTDSVGPAMAAFFPEGAYLQLKSIANAAGDFENRLAGEYAMDIGAAHALLGPDPRSATLVGVNVPQQYGHWIPPGVCTNSIGYFEVANSRIVYTQGGVTRSFGIASLISWRGAWYVVHLGAILRTTDTGVVLDPTTGPGSSAPSTTC